MKQSLRKSERGQILVILALALVGLLAFTALAVDVGMVFTDRRYYQNIADSAALAAAEKTSDAIRLNQYINKDGVLVTGIDGEGFQCGNNMITPANPLSSTNPPWSDSGWVVPGFLAPDDPDDGISRLYSYIDILNAAKSRAATNNVNIDFNDLSKQNGVVMRCVEEGTIDSSGEKQVDNRYVEVRVVVSGVTSTSLAHFAFGGVMRNTVEADVQIRTSSPIGFGDAILALNDTVDCTKPSIGGILFDGGPNVIAVGGSITSNRCMKTQAGNAYVRVLEAPDQPDNAATPMPTPDPNSCTLDEDAIRYMYTTGQPMNADICPPPQEMERPVRRQQLENPPNCHLATDQPAFRQNGPNSKGNIIPGHYPSIVVNGGDLTMAPGLYCIDGNFSFTGGNITTNDGKPCDGTMSTACGVTFWLNSKSGSFSLNGNGAMTLSAPASTKNVTAYSYPNILIGAPETYSGTVDIEGNSDDGFTGIIYVPYGELTIGGTSNLKTPDPTSTSGPQIYGQLIADRIKFHGTTSIHIFYDANRKIMGARTLIMSK